MRFRSRAVLPFLLPALAGMVVGAPIGGSLAAFSGTTATQIEFTAAPDWVAPALERTIAGKTAGGEPGFVRSGSEYYVYAQLSDTGNPASGVASVTADVSGITNGSTSAPLAAGTFSVFGQTYNYRSAALTSNTSLTEGSTPFTLAAADAAANQTQASQNRVTIDDTAPGVTGIVTTNGGPVAGAPDAADTVVFSFSERLDPTTIKPDWQGPTVSITIKIIDGGADPDRLIAYELNGTTQLAIGVLDLKRTGYVSEDVLFGSTSVPSTLRQSGQSLTLTLGAPQGTTAIGEGIAMMTLDPGSLSDPAGNPLPKDPISQSTAQASEF